nr:AMP-binding protein [Streptomyces rapamycinicus]
MAQLDVLAPAERERLLRQWGNASHSVTGADDTVLLPEVFEHQAERTPAAVAVVFEEQHLSYRGLNERANRLARVLVAAGAGPETRVALSLPRGPDLLITRWRSSRRVPPSCPSTRTTRRGAWRSCSPTAVRPSW